MTDLAYKCTLAYLGESSEPLLFKWPDYKLMIPPFLKNNLGQLIQKEVKDTTFMLLYFFTHCTNDTFCYSTCKLILFLVGNLGISEAVFLS